MSETGRRLSFHPNPPTIEDELNRRFTYHPPKGNQAERYTILRQHGRDLATLIVAETPMSREQSIALTKLDEAIMWANAAIARNE